MTHELACPCVIIAEILDVAGGESGGAVVVVCLLTQAQTCTLSS